MPRNPNNPQEFIAGKLPEVTFRNRKFYVDGRMRELRCVDDYSLKYIENEFFSIESEFSKTDLEIIEFEFYG